VLSVLSSDYALTVITNDTETGVVVTVVSKNNGKRAPNGRKIGYRADCVTADNRYK